MASFMPSSMPICDHLFHLLFGLEGGQHGHPGPVPQRFQGHGGPGDTHVAGGVAVLVREAVVEVEPGGRLDAW